MSNGVTVMELTPANAADMVSVWERSKLTCASYMVMLNREVCACISIFDAQSQFGL